MRNSSELRFVIDFEVTDLEVFKSAVRDAVEVSAAEPGTLLYDWYIDEAAGRARLYEAYDSADSIMAHTEIGPVLFGCCRITHIDAYGDAEAQKIAEALGPVTLWGKPFAAPDL
jgi:hypothetical protein